MGRNATKAIVLALLLAGAGSASAGKKSKTRVSSNGLYGIRLMELTEKSCRVEVVKEQEVAWTLDKCVGEADDLYFISDDGQRFWVLYPLPEKPEGVSEPSPRRGKHSKRPPPVLDAVVAAEYDKQGNPIQMKRLGDFLEARSANELRELGKHFKWLGGVLSVPGKPPILNDAGEIQFETLVGQSHKLKF